VIGQSPPVLSVNTPADDSTNVGSISAAELYGISVLRVVGAGGVKVFTLKASAHLLTCEVSTNLVAVFSPLSQVYFHFYLV